jgi:4-amino-4-deoxy-L-arabinose transferase-like glycosyltransferase
MLRKILKDDGLLLGLSITAFTIVIIRACLQSITIDEAGSYLIFARESWPAQWFPSSGNHVLNTILMRFVTTIFGFNELTTRLPAILGAAIYIASSAYLCALLTKRKLLQFALFACLVANPMILDYLVAARGYSLAIGFLMAALALFAKAVFTGSAGTKCPWISILIALSFAANFSFAIVDGTVLLFLFLWTRRVTGTRQAAISCFLPGFLVAFVLVGSVVWTFPKDQLYFGSNSLREMWRGLREATFDDLNPEVLNPLLLKWLTHTQLILPYVVVLTFLVLIVTIEVRRWRSGPAANHPLLTETRLLIGMAVVTLLVHWVAFRAMHLLLPKDRTALFFVPLLTLAFGSAVALLDSAPHPARARFAGIAVMLLVAIYFIGCLRLAYFKQWKFDADTKQLYWLVTDLRQRCGITDFVTDWRYENALNFYRRSYANDLLLPFHGSTSGELPRGHSAYVIFYPSSLEVIKEEHLNVIYHSGDSDASIAIRACPVIVRAGK